MKLSKEDIKLARKKVHELRKNPTRITEADRRGADEMFRKNEAFEKEKEDDITRDRKAVTKDLASFTYNQLHNLTVMTGREGINIRSCESDECYQCHMNKDLWLNDERPKKKAFFRVGFSTFCFPCFIKIYVPGYIRSMRKEMDGFIARVCDSLIKKLIEIKHKSRKKECCHA